MKTTLKGLLFVAALTVLAATTAQAAIDPATAKKLLAEDGAAGDEFGYSVSVDGDTAVIGARHDDSGKGTAYIFTRAGGVWSQQQKLTAGDGAAGDEFGYAVSVSGDMVIIGAHYNDSKKGAAYVFTRAGSMWSQQQKLLAADGAAGDDFGCSISISADGGTLLIGADWNAGINKGAAYVFTRAGSIWSQQQKLTAADGATGVFGRSVSLSSDGSIALIGNDFYASETGAAYIFTRSGSVWSQQQRLTASDGQAMDGFGVSVALSTDGGTALVGAYWNDGGKGAAYIFTRSVTRTGGVWIQQQKLTAADGAANDSFGDSVALSTDGGTALIAASRSSNNSGSAYVFTHTADGSWSQQQKLTAPGRAADSFFGGSVSLDGDTALIGAYGNYSNGSTYVFSSSAAPQGAAVQPAVNFLLRNK